MARSVNGNLMPSDIVRTSVFTTAELMREPTMNELLALAREISPWWKEFARCLRPCCVSYEEVLEIDEKYRDEGVVTKSHAMLQAWHMRCGMDGTVLHLCLAATKIKRKLAAERIFGSDLVKEASSGNCGPGAV